MSRSSWNFGLRRLGPTTSRTSASISSAKKPGPTPTPRTTCAFSAARSVHDNLVHGNTEALSGVFDQVALAEILVGSFAHREYDLVDRVQAHDIVDRLQGILVSDPFSLFGPNARLAQFADHRLDAFPGLAEGAAGVRDERA
jgi:hypothetical protein